MDSEHHCRKYTFKDAFFKTVQATPIIANLPLPLPVPYLQGLDLCKFEERMGQAWGNIYMAGNLRVNHHDGTLHGFPGYYFYAAFFKVPIATQLIFLVALFGYFWRRDRGSQRSSPGRGFPACADVGLLDVLQFFF